MAKTKQKEDFEIVNDVEKEEDEATLAAIDEGLKDSKAGRTVTLERVRELLPKWITASSSPKKR